MGTLLDLVNGKPPILTSDIVASYSIGTEEDALDVIHLIADITYEENVYDMLSYLESKIEESKKQLSGGTSDKSWQGEIETSEMYKKKLDTAHFILNGENLI